MSKVQVTVEVTKEFHELGEGLANLVTVIKPALKDGLQASDVGAIIAAVIGFIPALKGVEQLGAEALAESEAFAMAGAVTLAKIVKAIRA